MSDYANVTVEIVGDDNEYDLNVPHDWLPRIGETIDLTYDERFPSDARVVTVTDVRWYQASFERYRPIIVVTK